MGSRDISWTILPLASWGFHPRPRALESIWLHLRPLSKEQGTVMIHIYTSCILEPCKTQGLSVLGGEIGKNLCLQKCQLPAIAGAV